MTKQEFKDKKWVACLMSGFKDVYFNTKKQAEDYIISQNCSLCKGEGLSSRCAMEWLILKNKDYKKCKNIDDIFEAGGYKEITAKEIQAKLKIK